MRGVSEIADRDMVAELLIPEVGELLSAGRTEEVAAALSELRDPEVADVLRELDDAQRARAFEVLPPERAADVFDFLEQHEQEAIVEHVPDEHLATVFNEMDLDDRVEFLEDAPEEVVDATLALMEPQEREQTQKSLEYPEESVGRLITTDFLTLRPEWPVRRALDHIRANGEEAETLHTLYVVDERDRLIDHIRLRRLVLARPDQRCDELREGQVVSLRVDEDREEAVRVMERYDLPVLPVVDADGVLVGIVTFDDVADVAEEEITEDIQMMGGLSALDAPYLTVSLGDLIRKRVIWLTVLFGGEIITIAAISRFQHQIATVVALAFFMPLIIASGGNSGSQAATLIIRAMAVDDVALRDWWAVVRRELVTGLSMGIWLAMVGAAVVGLFSAIGFVDFQGHAMRLALAIPVSLVCVVTCGCMLGSTLPMLLRRVGLDPATGSNPLVATLMDVTGLLIYFSTTMAILGI